MLMAKFTRFRIFLPEKNLSNKGVSMSMEYTAYTMYVMYFTNQDGSGPLV